MSVADVLDAHPAGRTRLIRRAVASRAALSMEGMAERAFALVFSGLVYPQIWEDPEVDMEAMEIAPGDRVVTIASGGCNALSYLLADPAHVEAIDLNRVHVAFNRLKRAALMHLPDYDSFFAFVGRGDDKANLDLYMRHLRHRLDDETRAYWEGRGMDGRRRIMLFTRGTYRHGLLGRFIGAGHLLARRYHVDFAPLLNAQTVEEQREWFERELSPLFDRPLVKWLTTRKSSLFGLGIPPQQYDALAGERKMATVLKERLRKVACDFPISQNYFAWQAFARCYGEASALPPYLARENYEAVKERAARLSVENASYSEFLAAKPAGSVHRFVLLDAQDWMNDAQLNTLWREITRAAAPGARVIFRTAGEERLLPGRVAAEVLDRWHFEQDRSAELHAKDRSGIYGAFHLYRLRG
jgi:S-adenosylmethionine-diacylglycerol 3-amino-3-carboxypropyl transferase